MSANAYIGTSGLEAAVFELWLPVSFDSVGIGVLEIHNTENGDLAVGCYHMWGRVKSQNMSTITDFGTSGFRKPYWLN